VVFLWKQALNTEKEAKRTRNSFQIVLIFVLPKDLKASKGWIGDYKALIG